MISHLTSQKIIKYWIDVYMRVQNRVILSHARFSSGDGWMHKLYLIIWSIWQSWNKIDEIIWKSTQNTVQPVPTRHRRYACIIMRTALPANMKTWPDVVSMLVQRRWRWANSETSLGRILAYDGLHTGVCQHPPLPHHNILASRSGYF